MCAIPAKKRVDYKAYLTLLHILGMPYGVALLKTTNNAIKYFMAILIHVMALTHVIFYFLTVKSKLETSVTAVKVFTFFQGLRVIGTVLIVLNRNIYKNAHVEVASITFKIEKRFLGKYRIIL
nr:unnamed protein product [Callosobruchus chinensis]